MFGTITVLKILFIILCLVLLSVLIVSDIKMYNKNKYYSVDINYAIIVSCISIVSYCLFLCINVDKNNTYRGAAVLFDGLFFVGTDWLALCMFLFAVDYTGIWQKYRKHFIYVFSAFCMLDTVSLFLNIIYRHSFQLIYMEDSLGVPYWGNEFFFIHYLHLGFCYIMVGATLLLLVVAFIKTPSTHKQKYLGILLMYALVILANFISYSMNYPIDFSVPMYAFLAGFICFYSTLMFPDKLVNKILFSVNETISDGILFFDLKGKCIYANKTAEKLFSDLKGYNQKKAETYLETLLTNLNGDDEVFTKGSDTFEIDDKKYFYEVIYQKEFDKKGVEIGTCIHLIDKTKEQEQLNKERYSATHDDLTGLLNRNGFFEAVDRDIAENGCENRIMICSNIRDFKLVNEMFGDEIGDKLLLGQGKILKEYSHPSSIYGRISDDRFALYMKSENYNEGRLKLFMEQLVHIAESSVYQLHFNVGVYKVQQGIEEAAQEMYNKALLALGSINSDYSVIFAHYDSLVMEKLLYKQHLTKDFENAISSGQIKMYLQPIMDLNNNQVGAEALCRWKHPLRGLMLPDSFLYVLEESGLIYELDEYIWEQAAKTLKQWNSLGIKNCYISVNVSYKDFYYSDIYKTFTRLVEKYDIEPSMLHIEITETVLMADFKKAAALSEKLQKSGFNVAIDNFGNGYSSFSMLKDFKPTVLKLDRQLLENAPEDVRSQIILEAIVEMGKALGIVVIGEGVETKNQLEILKKLGCHAYQGNYISEPLTEELYSERYIKTN